MPGFDQSGPKGQGPATGRMRGMCPRTDYSAFAHIDRGRGKGLGIGQGAGAPGALGTGRGRRQTTAVERRDDLESLKKQYESARKMMEELQEKITAMETQQR